MTIAAISTGSALPTTNGLKAFGLFRMVNAPRGISSRKRQQRPAKSPAGSSSQIDNCCFVDRQCESDEQWTSGYWAYQNNQCPRAQNSQSQSRASGPASEAVDNCCFIGWQCNTDEEWRSGYWAFQHDQCDSPTQWPEQWSQIKQLQRQSSSAGQYPVKRTYDPYTGTTVFEYEDGVEIIARRPTREELCDAGLVEFCDDE